MITADKVKALSTIKRDQMRELLNAMNKDSGIMGDYVTKCHFLGLTNAGQFCYALQYDARSIRTMERWPRMFPAKVFITINPEGSLTATV